MRVSHNQKLIKRRARLGTYATFAGLAVLVAGMIASFQPRFLYLSLAALLVGFALSQYGNYSLRRWGRSPRPDEMIANSLKGFDDRYHFFSWSLPAPFVLLGPQGVYTFATRDQAGEITVTGSQWRSKMTIGKVLTAFAQEGLGNPTREAQERAAAMEKWIKSELPELDVTVQPAVVFLNERAQLKITDPTVPVLEAKGLKRWLRGAAKGTNLKNAEYRALVELFERRAGE